MKAYVAISCLIAVIASALPVEARDITENVHWGVQRSTLSLARMRVSVGPKVIRAACKSYWNVLRSGGTVHVNFIGAGDQLITSFHVTKDKCK